MYKNQHHTPDPSSVHRHLSDPLGEILHLLKLSGTFYCQSELSAPWGIEIPEMERVMTFLVVTSGHCWLEIEGAEPIYMEQGNLALLTGGSKHRLYSEPDAKTESLETLHVNKISERFETLQYGGGGDLTLAMYGIIRFDHAAGQQLMELMPNVIRIETWSDDSDGWLQSTMQFISREARELRPGGETVITRLADILVIQAIRKWIDTAPEAKGGWLNALRDHQIGQAIIAIHREPANDWTVNSLAETVNMSRSAFSEKFTELVGQPAMRYLTHWRMQLAHAKIRESSVPLAAIAFDLGYRSEATFSRAFKRVFDISPGSVRSKKNNQLTAD